MSTAATNKKIVLEFFEQVFNARDFSPGMAATLHPDLVCHHAGKVGATSGEQAWKRFQYMVTTVAPEFKMHVKKAVADDEQVWVWSTITGLPGGAKKESVDIVRLEKGKIIETWDVQEEVKETA